MSTQEQRERFEAWCDSEGINPDRSVATGVYLYPSARVAWRAFQAAEAAAIERCAKVCDEYAIDQWNLYKGRSPYNGSEDGRANPHVEGKSDGADACAEAIRALLTSDAHDPAQPPQNATK